MDDDRAKPKRMKVVVLSDIGISNLSLEEPWRLIFSYKSLLINAADHSTYLGPLRHRRTLSLAVDRRKHRIRNALLQFTQGIYSVIMLEGLH